MIVNKYARDYRLENRLDQKGRTVTRAVYIGKFFVFARTDSEVKRGRKLLLTTGIAAAAMILIGLAFYNNRNFSAQYYTIIPFFACAFPLIWYGMALKSAYVFKDRYTREQKDNTYDRLARCSFLGMLFSGIDLAGIAAASVVCVLNPGLKEAGIGDIGFISASAGLFAAFLISFLNRGTVRMKEAEEPGTSCDEKKPENEKNGANPGA